MKWSSLLLVLAQFACIGFLLWQNGWPNTLAGAGCWMLSLLLVSWVGITPGAIHLRIFPEPSANARLMTSGPYHWIRHPLYSAVLLFCFGCVLDAPFGGNLPVFAFLVMILVLKIRREEQYLIDKFPSYLDYSSKTKRLFPFLY